MKFEYLIALIVLFNIANAVWRKRARKAKELPGPRNRGGGAFPRTEPAPARPREKGREVDFTEDRGDLRGEHGHSKRPAPAAAPPRPAVVHAAPAAARSASARPPLNVNLKGAKKLQEAFILKEILDPPLSRRRS